jgi:hypothetical protein
MMDLQEKSILGEVNMAVNYEKMYVTLFQGVTKAISGLQEAQRETEEEYIKANPTGTVLKLISKAESSSKEDDADE